MQEELSSFALILAGGVASKDTLNRLFGPTADYLGKILQHQTERGIGNLRKVWESAARRMKLDPDSSSSPNGRVLSRVFNEARFVEDSVAAEYFAGVLASSCSDGGADDSALPYVELLKSMSTDEVKLHFVLYSSLSRRFFGWPSTAAHFRWNECTLFLPTNDLLTAIPTWDGRGLDQLEIALNGLVDHGLVDNGARLVREDVNSIDRSKKSLSAGISFCATDRGARLLLRALGLKGLTPSVLTTMKIESSLTEDLIGLLVDPQVIVVSAKLPLKSARDDLVEALEDLESKIDDLETRLDANDETE